MSRGPKAHSVGARFDRWADVRARIQRAIDALVDDEIDFAIAMLEDLLLDILPWADQ